MNKMFKVKRQIEVMKTVISKYDFYHALFVI